MLIYEDDYDAYSGRKTVNSKFQLAEIERRVAQKEQYLKDMEYELNLLKDRRLSIYKSNIRYNIVSFIKPTRDWLIALDKKEINGEKLDGRKSYKEKDLYNYFINWLSDELGCDEAIQITKIYDWNFGEGWNIYFMYKGHEWDIDFPIIDHVSKKSFNEYGDICFKIVIRHKNGCCLDWVGATFEEDELKEIFQKGVDKYVV